MHDRASSGGVATAFEEYKLKSIVKQMCCALHRQMHESLFILLILAINKRLLIGLHSTRGGSSITQRQTNQLGMSRLRECQRYSLNLTYTSKRALLMLPYGSVTK